MSNQTTSSDFQIECFRAANNRLLFRVKRRDNWLKIQLLVQLTILALALGMREQTYLLFLSIPLSFIFVGLYVSEDRLVGHIVSYLNSLSKNQSKSGNSSLLNLESSPEGKDYVNTALPVRLITQVFSFLMLPLGILVFRYSADFLATRVSTIELIIGLLLSTMIAWLLFSTYRLRIRKTSASS